ncbi:DUF5979 domain-containing protein [Actinomyces naeslundii]|uniref:DUF7926 domain-containing protein n=1 Tax=Actinomyces naeslundii TaxID=1655 RepID=UPI00094CFA78|nr:DUF5979 domain-containing protein [Actinomyces naeslundii]OLO81256.1 peptidase [Actinomyces naeslundii]
MSAIPIPRVLGTPARAIGALVALVALVATLLTVLPTQARAANNPSITVSGLSLVVSNANGVEEPDNTSVKVDDILKLKFAWDARNASARSGDSFQIQLPEQLRNRERLSEPMKVSHQGAEHTIGECVMNDRAITCTFNSTLDTIVGQGFTGLQGNGTALVLASQASDSANVTIDANGKQTEVPVPGGKIAENVGLEYKPQWMSKWAADVTSTSKTVDWEISFGPDQVKAALEKNGGSLTVDGKTRSTITFTDQLGPGQAYVTNKSSWKLSIGAAQGRNNFYGQVTDASGADKDVSQGDFDLDVTIQGNTATVAVTGPFAPQTNYHIYYASTPSTADGVVQAGVEYTNKASVVGSGLEHSYSVHYTKSFTINVEMKPGFGGLDITKLLTGSETAKVPAGTTFQVGINYTLPGGATVDTYPGWQAPGTVNQARTGGSTSMTVTVGEKAVYNGTFPVGTVLTLDEDTTTASATPAGVVWGSHTFTVGDQNTNSLTVEDQKSTAVTLRNSADPAAVEEGDFTVTKALAGDGDFSKSTFEFTYTCTDGTEGSLTVTGAATSEKSKKVKAGSTCTITEDSAKAGQNGYTLTAPAAQTVTITKDQTAAVTMTNTYARDMGTFSVTKVVTGLESVDNEFAFSYTCDNNVKGTLKVKADGSVASGPELPVGTKCTIEEDAQSAAVKGYTLEAPASQTVTISEKEQAVLVTFTNAYTPEPEPTPTPTPTPSESPTPEPTPSPTPTPSESPTPEPSPTPTPEPTPTPSESPTPEPTPSPTPEPSPTPSESPTPGETPDPSESPTPAPSESPSPDPSATPDPSDPATPGAPSSPSGTPPAAPSDPAKSQEPSGGPLASTGVRVGLPLAVAVFAVMGGALLVSRRRA